MTVAGKKGIVIRTRTICSGTLLSGNPLAELKVEITNLDEVLQKRHEGFGLLASEIGIPLKDWCPAAFALAERFAPNLQPIYTRRAGAPERWHALRSLCLWWDVEVLKTRGRTINQACSFLEKQPQWKRQFQLGSLRSAYYRHALKSPLVKTLRNAMDELGFESIRTAIGDLVDLDRRSRLLSEADDHLRKL